MKIDPLDAELLLAHVLNKPREWVLANPENEVIKLKVIKFIKLAKQRERGVPLAYLTGHKEFFGLDFEVNKSVLIPRPDTEVLVTSALEHLSTSAHKPITLIDIGTGSGCIPISVIKTLKHKNIKAIAIDTSKQALIVAKRNAKRHNVKIKFIQSNLLAPIVNNRTIEQLNNHHIIITANLPYLTPKQFNSSPSIQHEPRSALVAGKDGLKYYRKLLTQIRQLLTTFTTLQLTTFLEIDPSQSLPITRLIKSILPTANVQIIKDLSGLDRIVKVCYTI